MNSVYSYWYNTVALLVALLGIKVLLLVKRHV